MIPVIKGIICSLAASIAACGMAAAASSPLGIWIDHTGRGAVEIQIAVANCADISANTAKRVRSVHWNNENTGPMRGMFLSPAEGVDGALTACWAVR